jgi:hypothetical protein
MKYQSEHYEDVAKILLEHGGYTTAMVVTDDIVRAFADLFAADNPGGPCPGGCGTYRSGFNRTDFLTACGLKS